MMGVLPVAVDHLHSFLGNGPGSIPSPGTGSPPPGYQKIEAMLQWLAWGVTACAVAGVLMVAARMAITHHRGEGGQHMTGLAWVLGACILIGAVSGIVGALV